MSSKRNLSCQWANERFLPTFKPLEITCAIGLDCFLGLACFSDIGGRVVGVEQFGVEIAPIPTHMLFDKIRQRRMHHQKNQKNAGWVATTKTFSSKQMRSFREISHRATSTEI